MSEPEAKRRANASTFSPRCRGRLLQKGYVKPLVHLKASVEPSHTHYSRLLEKQQQVPSPTMPSEPHPPSAHIADHVVLKSIKSFPNGTAPSPSGLRASYFKEVVQCPSPNKSAHVLQAIVNLIAAGKAPTTVVPHLCGANLLAFSKKDGGLRPENILVGGNS